MPQEVNAIEDPLRVPNNKFGVHILFESELKQAAELVNSNGGDWGYVTMPIQATDKNLVKWQTFLDNAKRYHIIPIIRIATEGDYFNTSVWRKPNPSDIVDFANFLDSLDWPVKNKYVVIFNEVNRGDEWGGTVNPQEYADLLSYAVTVFKSKDPNFFVISSGMDNAAPNQGNKFMNQYTYMQQMNAAVPGIFNQIDGISSHSYPNPAFSQPPNNTSMMGTGSFIYERQLTRKLSNKDLPVFITETGWTSDAISDDMRAQYYQTALSTIWNDSSIVAITPFLLQSNAGPFQQFTFLNNNTPTKQYQMFRNLPKIKGLPAREVKVLSATTNKTSNIEKYDFTHYRQLTRRFSLSEALQGVFKWIMKI